MSVNDALIRTIKTIASGFIEKAGFNRTRTGQIIGVNSITNTYSVRVDGQIYPNVPVEGNGTFVVGDVAKVHIPNNQPSQMYMTAWGNSVDLTNILGSSKIPIENGGTNADTAKTALANLGGVSMDLLWENASPTSSFPSQNISVDLSEYNMFLIITTERFEIITLKGLMGSVYRNASLSGYARAFSFSNSGVGISGGEVITYGASWATDLNVLKPLYIYGIII